MMNENEPIYSVGALTAGAAAGLSMLVAMLPLSESKKVTLLTGLAVGGPLVAAHVGRRYVAPLGPNRIQAGEGHVSGAVGMGETVDEVVMKEAGGGPDAQPEDAPNDDGRS